MSFSSVGGVGGLPPDVAGTGAPLGTKAGATAAEKLGTDPKGVEKFASHLETLTKNGVTRDAEAENFLQESMVSAIVQRAQEFGQQLPGSVSGSSIVSQLIEKAKKGAPDPSDPGAHVLDPE